jgi:hypothetical protein
MLRRLFITILRHCSPADPLTLWEQLKPKLSDDCAYMAQARFGIESLPDDEASDLCLFLL